MDKLMDDLLLELECPICTLYMAPPIRQCKTGHSFCEPCRKKLPLCPNCQEPFTEAKNLSLEALARKMHYPCVNNKGGCTERLTLNEREEHERNCSFKLYKCQYIKCKWFGKYEDIGNHWMEKKLTSRPYRNKNVCHAKVQKAESYYVNMIEAYGSLFWYKFKTSGGKMFWSVQYIGPNERAKDYYFEIELFKPGQPIPKILMVEYCQPLDIDSEFKAGSCVMTSMEAVSPFFGEDQLLIYYMRVKETDESSGSLNRDQSCSRESLTHLNQAPSHKKFDNQPGGFKPKYKKYSKKKADQ